MSDFTKAEQDALAARLASRSPWLAQRQEFAKAPARGEWLGLCGPRQCHPEFAAFACPSCGAMWSTPLWRRLPTGEWELPTATIHFVCSKCLLDRDVIFLGTELPPVGYVMLTVMGPGIYLVAGRRYDYERVERTYLGAGEWDAPKVLGAQESIPDSMLPQDPDWLLALRREHDANELASDEAKNPKANWREMSDVPVPAGGGGGGAKPAASGKPTSAPAGPAPTPPAKKKKG